MAATLIPSSKNEVLRLINAKNGTSLTFQDVKLEVLPGSTEASKVKVTPVVGGRYLGQQVIDYTRLDLTKVFQGVTAKIEGSAGMTNAQAVTEWARVYGIELDDTDFDMAGWGASPVVFPEGSATGTITLTPASTSLGFVKTLEVTVTNAAYDLNTIITTANLPGLKYTDNTDGTKPQGAVVTYPINYTTLKVDLATLAKDGKVSQPIADKLIQATNQTGNSVMLTAADIVGGTVIYNGPTSGYVGTDTSASKLYENVAVVALAADNAKFQGNLYFHYTPVTPAVTLAV